MGLNSLTYSIRILPPENLPFPRDEIYRFTNLVNSHIGLKGLTNPETPQYNSPSMTVDYTKLPPFESPGQRMSNEVFGFNRRKAALKALKLLSEGLKVDEIAEEMDVARRTAYLYLKLGKQALKRGEFTDDQVMELGQISDAKGVQRRRLMKRLRKSDEVIGQAMDSFSTKEPALAQVATRAALALNKGLGILQEETISKSVTFEEKRLIISAQLGLAEQYGAKVPKEIKAEIVEVKDE